MVLSVLQAFPVNARIAMTTLLNIGRILAPKRKHCSLFAKNFDTKVLEPCHGSTFRCATVGNIRHSVLEDFGREKYCKVHADHSAPLSSAEMRSRRYRDEKKDNS